MSREICVGLFVAAAASVLLRRATKRRWQCQACGDGAEGGDGASRAACPPRVAAQQLDARFFATKDPDGNLRINTRFIDMFLRWGCGRHLLGLGLFPNVQEITESMACLEAVREHLAGLVSLSCPAVCAVVVGDGRTPRTGALLAMRTKWHVVSIDPALHGLQPPRC